MKRKFTEEEVKEYVFENEVESVDYDTRRWVIAVETVVEVDEKFYALHWARGRSENQEHQFESQTAYEVKLVEEEKTIMVKSWVPIDG